MASRSRGNFAAVPDVFPWTSSTIKAVWMRRVVRWCGWLVVFMVGVLVIWLTQTWLWWQDDPRSPGTDTNGLWARHQWVGQPHTDAEYRNFAALLRQNRISDVFVHAGPIEADGSIPPARYAHAPELVAALHRFAPGVHVQAYLGQIRKIGGDGGVLRLDDPAVRSRLVAAAGEVLASGFDGIHYDIEPIYPGDQAFLDLLARTRAVTRGRLLSASVEQLTLFDGLGPVLRPVLNSGGRRIYPPRPTTGYLRAVASRVDQVAIMTYDSDLPTGSLVGRYYADQTEAVLREVGDRVTIFMGVPTYRTVTGWAEDLPTALRGVRKGIDAYGRTPHRPFGVAVYPEWTTSLSDWAHYRTLWPAPTAHPG